MDIPSHPDPSRPLHKPSRRRASKSPAPRVMHGERHHRQDDRDQIPDFSARFAAAFTSQTFPPQQPRPRPRSRRHSRRYSQPRPSSPLSYNRTPTLQTRLAEMSDNADRLLVEYRTYRDEYLRGLQYLTNLTRHEFEQLRAQLSGIEQMLERLRVDIQTIRFSANPEAFYVGVRVPVGRNLHNEFEDLGEPGPEVETVFSDAGTGVNGVTVPSQPHTNHNVNVNGINVPHTFTAQPNFRFPSDNQNVHEHHGNIPQHIPLADLPQNMEATNVPREIPVNNMPSNISVNSVNDEDPLLAAWNASGNDSRIGGGANDGWSEENSHVSFGNVGEGEGGDGEGIEGSIQVQEDIDAQTLKASLMYSVGECTGMLKTFSRLATGRGGVKNALDNVGRDMYRALREMEKKMDAARGFNGEL